MHTCAKMGQSKIWSTQMSQKLNVDKSQPKICLWVNALHCNNHWTKTISFKFHQLKVIDSPTMMDTFIWVFIGYFLFFLSVLIALIYFKLSCFWVIIAQSQRQKWMAFIIIFLMYIESSLIILLVMFSLLNPLVSF